MQPDSNRQVARSRGEGFLRVAHFKSGSVGEVEVRVLRMAHFESGSVEEVEVRGSPVWLIHVGRIDPPYGNNLPTGPFKGITRD